MSEYLFDTLFGFINVTSLHGKFFLASAGEESRKKVFRQRHEGAQSSGKEFNRRLN